MKVVLALLSGVGLYISLYFSLVYYRVIDARSVFVPSFCRMETNSCYLIIHHHDAKVFGLPNSVLGVVYYLIVLLDVAIESPMVHVFAWLISCLAVAVGMYLVYSLYFKVKVACSLCFVCHVINALIATVLTLWW